MSEYIVRAENLVKTYTTGPEVLEVLRGVRLKMRAGEFLAVTGVSGSGKSTLLHLLGLLDEWDSGTIYFDDQDVSALSAAQRDQLRNQEIGFVFQFYHLLPELTVLENTLLPTMVANSTFSWLGNRAKLRKQAMEILAQLGLADRAKHRPAQLSGGEQQRTAIARALVNKPRLLLADEPTGNLDLGTGGRILDLLEDLNANNKQTIIMVTHDPDTAGRAHRQLHLDRGRIHTSSS
ncbi:MAG: ATP-binding cassette domain-containing protein [Actinobacteria bacterium]|nr:ATP-binding cassette domain-containing protein [Actinomycetota bacterium]